MAKEYFSLICQGLATLVLNEQISCTARPYYYQYWQVIHHD